MKLLFISATRIGDAVLSTALLGHLLDRHPGAAVTIACGAPAQALFAAVPGLARIIVLEKRRYAGHWFGLWAAVAGQRWDIAVDLRGSLLTNFLWRGAAIVDRHAHPEAHRVVELARLIGIDKPPAPRIWLTPDHRARAAALLRDLSPVLAIAPAANWGPKTWPIERFVALMQILTAPGAPLATARVLVVAAPGERAQVAPLIAAIPPARLIDLSGGGDLLDVAACLQRARLFVGNDSGLMHLAAAAGAPTLGLFGPSPDTRYGPWGPDTALVRTPESYEALMARVRRGETGAGAMMATLTVEAVADAALALIARTPR